MKQTIRITSWIVFVVLFATVALHAQAQTSFVPSGSVTFGFSDGYQSPVVLGGVGVEVENPNFLITNSVEGGVARKAVEPYDGYALITRNNAYFKHRLLIVGGGVTYGKQFTSEWTKSSVRPVVSGGVDDSAFRLTLSYEGSGTDRSNDEKSVGVDFELYAGKHWSWDQNVWVSWFHATGDQSDRRQGVTIYEGIRFRK